MNEASIACFGANSTICKDFLKNLHAAGFVGRCHLYVRNTSGFKEEINFLLHSSNRFEVRDYASFNSGIKYNLLLNFIGGGDPYRVREQGREIFCASLAYDQMLIDYLALNNETLYINMSSGAVREIEEIKFSEGSELNFSAVTMGFDNVDPYTLSKFSLECRHRMLDAFKVVDLRIYGYFSLGFDATSSFFLGDIYRAYATGSALKTTKVEIVRDYVGERDVFNAISCIYKHSGFLNRPFELYSMGAVKKSELINQLKLNVEYTDERVDYEPAKKRYDYQPKDRSLGRLNYSPSCDSFNLVKHVLVSIKSNKKA